MPAPRFYGEIYNYGYTTDRLNDSSGNKIKSVTGAARSEFERCGAIRNKSRASDRSADLADRSNTAIFTKLSDD